MMLGQWGQATDTGWLCGLAVVAAMGTLLTAPRQHCGFAVGAVSCQHRCVLTQLLPRLTPPPQELLMGIVWSLWNMCRICPRLHCPLSHMDRTSMSRLNMLQQAEG